MIVKAPISLKTLYRNLYTVAPTGNGSVKNMILEDKANVWSRIKPINSDDLNGTGISVGSGPASVSDPAQFGQFEWTRVESSGVRKFNTVRKNYERYTDREPKVRSTSLNLSYFDLGLIRPTQGMEFSMSLFWDWDGPLTSSDEELKATLSLKEIVGTVKSRPGELTVYRYPGIQLNATKVVSGLTQVVSSVFLSSNTLTKSVVTISGTWDFNYLDNQATEIRDVELRPIIVTSTQSLDSGWRYTSNLPILSTKIMVGGKDNYYTFTARRTSLTPGGTISGDTSGGNGSIIDDGEL